MRGYLIDPFAKTVTEIDYNGDFHTIYKHIDAGCFDICHFTRDNADGVYVDDNGLLSDLDEQAFFMIGSYPGPLAGKGLVLGCDDEGETIGAQTELADLNVRFLSLSDIRSRIDRGEFA